MNKLGNLTITKTIYQKHAINPARIENGFNCIIIQVQDPQGNKGHILYGLEIDKRSVEDELILTDNPQLHCDIEPSDFQDLFAADPEIKATSHPIETGQIITQCLNGHELTYEETCEYQINQTKTTTDECSNKHPHLTAIFLNTYP